MPSNEFQRVCRDLSAFGDAVQISVVKKSIIFKVVGGEDGEASITILETDSDDVKDEDRISLSVHDPVSLTFSFKYLHHFCRGAPLSPHVTLTLTKDKPLICKYEIDGIGNIKYYLAPKVDDEEAADDDD